MTEAETILDKARGKITLARKLEAEAASHGKKKKALLKEAAGHRAEADQLLLDNSQTEMTLEIVKWKCQACDATFTSNPGEMHMGEVDGKKYSCGPVVAVEREEEEPEEDDEDEDDEDQDDADGGDEDDEDEPELDAEDPAAEAEPEEVST